MRMLTRRILRCLSLLFADDGQPFRWLLPPELEGVIISELLPRKPEFDALRKSEVRGNDKDDSDVLVILGFRSVAFSLAYKSRANSRRRSCSDSFERLDEEEDDDKAADSASQHTGSLFGDMMKKREP